MADESAAELVARCYQRLLERKGVTKGAGAAAIDHHELTAEVVAEIGVMWDRQLKKNRKVLKATGRKVAALAAREGVPGAGAVEARFRDLNEQEFGLQLVRTRAAKQANGHSRGDGPAPEPPSWHPENGGV